MVSMGAGSNVYEAWSAVLVGSLAGAVYLSLSSAMGKLRLDDPLDAVAVHFGGGWLGVMCVPIFSQPITGHDKGILWNFTSVEAWKHMGINAGGAFTITLWSLFWGLLIFGLLNYFDLLRVSPQAERKGIDLVSYLQSLEEKGHTREQIIYYIDVRERKSKEKLK